MINGSETGYLSSGSNERVISNSGSRVAASLVAQGRQISSLVNKNDSLQPKQRKAQDQTEVAFAMNI